MDIVIRERVADNQHNKVEIDGSFTVHSELVFSVQDNQITYMIKPIPPYEKSYEEEQLEEDSNNIDHSNPITWLAFADERVVGQMRVKRNWNQYAYIEEILVDKQFRGLHIGKKLIQQAIQWAKAGKMPGIMLETQSNNVAACKFYESCGFVLGGLDAYVYKGIHQSNSEVALYWYLLFE